MLVRFSSVKTESVLMFGTVADKLIKMLGASGAIPGAIAAEDIPTAVKRLREQLATTSPASDSTQSDENEKEREPDVDLLTRAGPLLDILERASAVNVPVMWEPVK